MIDKPIKDLTPEEREQVIEELKATATPEELESLTELSKWIGDAQAWLRLASYNSAFYKDMDSEIAQGFMQALREFLPALIEELRSDEDAAKMTPTELVQSDKYDEIVRRAADRAGVKGIEKMPSIIVRNIKKTDFPIDKVNRNVWKTVADANGQIAFKIDVSNSDSDKPIDVLYAIDFSDLDNVSISKDMTPYDKRVYIACDGLYRGGYDVVSAQQIYRAMMGNPKARASKTDINKINKSLDKMMFAHLYIDNIQEIESGYNRKHFKYDAPLLPMERIQAYINGQFVDAAIHFFRDMPLISFARERGNITTIEIALLDSPLSKTNANIDLEDYLIEEIARIKNGKRNPKMLYETIYKEAGITTAMQLKRAPEKIKKLLEHYIACNYIKAYKTTKDAIIIEY